VECLSSGRRCAGPAGCSERLGGDGVGLPEVATVLTEVGPPRRHHAGAGNPWLWHAAAARPGLRRAAEPIFGGVAKGGVLTAALNEPGAPLPDRPATTFTNGSVVGHQSWCRHMPEQAHWLVVTGRQRGGRGVAEGRRRAADQTPTSNGSDEYQP